MSFLFICVGLLVCACAEVLQGNWEWFITFATLSFAIAELFEIHYMLSEEEEETDEVV